MEFGNKKIYYGQSAVKSKAPDGDLFFVLNAEGYLIKSMVASVSSIDASWNHRTFLTTLINGNLGYIRPITDGLSQDISVSWIAICEKQ